MSTGREGRPTRCRFAGGFTLVEMTLALVIFAAMALLVERTLGVTRDTENYLDAVRRSTERGQRIAFEIYDAVSTSRKIFGDDVRGRAYLGALDLSLHDLRAGARLPMLDENGLLEPDDPASPLTGNVLLFVRESDPAPCVADATLGKVRYIDTYRFLCVYPHETIQRVLTDGPLAADLVLWRSVVYPSHPQIMAIEDPTERRNVVKDLVLRFKYDRAWNPNEPVDQAFHLIDAAGDVVPAPLPKPTIERDDQVSEGGRLVYASVQLARTDPQSYPRRPVFTRDDPATWKPDGFELKVVGQSGSRKVWMHLVVECQSGRGRVAVHESTIVASVRDL